MHFFGGGGGGDREDQKLIIYAIKLVQNFDRLLEELLPIKKAHL